MRLVLLPGMDGTGTLFTPFVKCLPPHVQASVIPYPDQTHLDYEQLVSRVRTALPTDEPYVIIAESYSGPIALSLATEPVGDLRAVVLVATFATRPLGSLGLVARYLPWSAILRIPPPDCVLRFLLLHKSTSGDVAAAVRQTIRRVDPRVLAARIRSALTVDACEALKRCRTRLVCLMSSHDRLLGTRAGGPFHKAPNAEVITVDAPHFLLQCAPDAAMAELTKAGIFDAT